MNKEFFKLVSTHVNMQGVKNKGRRWPQEYRQFTLYLYFHGPKDHRLSSGVLDLPTARTLKFWLSNIQAITGITPHLIDLELPLTSLMSSRRPLKIDHYQVVLVH